MQISNKGIELIKKFEGCRLCVYLDAVGVPTSGYGHTKGLSAVDVGKPISQSEADANLESDLKVYEAKVEKYNPRYKWVQNEFDALVSFAFNIGSIDQLTDYGKRSRNEIAEKMLLYNRAGGKILAGLTKRRIAEQEMFLSSNTISTTGIKTFSLTKEGELKLSPHFKIKEFKCKDGSNAIVIDTDFVRTYLEKIREHFNSPVTINSAFRTLTYNAKVGGAKKSYHLQGRAFDIVVKGHTPEEVARYAAYIGVKGVIQYNAFVHVDSREETYHAKNYNGVVTTVSSF